jgi:hypothetical protein
VSRFPYTRLGFSRCFLLLAIITVPKEEEDVWKPMWPISDLIKIKQAQIRKAKEK